MVSLQVLLVGQHRHIGIPKAATQTSVEHSEKSLRKKIPKLAWILATKVAWIWRGFIGAGRKGAENFRGDFGTRFVTKFVTTLVTKFVPVSSKIRDRIRVCKAKNPPRAPTLRLRSELSD